jgi:hypothetical protein
MPKYVIGRVSPQSGRPRWFGGSRNHAIPIWTDDSDEAEQFRTRTKAESTLDTLRRVAPDDDRLRIIEIIS